MNSIIEAFKLGFGFAAGAITAAFIGLAILGAWDWASGWLGYLATVIRLARRKDLSITPAVLNPGESLMGGDKPLRDRNI